MKSWKKGAIVGGMWGLVGIAILSKTPGTIFPFSMHRPSTIPYYIIILAFPSFISAKLSLEWGEFFLLYLITFFLGAILIGALIGSVVGLTVKKFTQRRTKK